MEKYEILLKDAKRVNDRTLYRIKALRDVGDDVKEGDLGGYIQSEYNLSHEGSCWVYDKACAYDKAQVLNDACLRDYAHLRGNAKMDCRALLKDRARVGGSVVLTDFVIVGGNVELYDRVRMDRHATALDNVRAFNSVYLTDKASVGGDAILKDRVIMRDITEAKGKAVLDGDTVLEDDIVVDKNKLEETEVEPKETEVEPKETIESRTNTKKITCHTMEFKYSTQHFDSYAAAAEFVRKNNIKDKDIMNLQEHISIETIQVPVLDFTAGRNVYFKEGQTMNKQIEHSTWSLTYRYL